jgi:hypothetical protein
MTEKPKIIKMLEDLIESSRKCQSDDEFRAVLKKHGLLPKKPKKKDLR